MNALPRLYFLRIGSDYLDDARAYQTKSGAIAAYRRCAVELARYDQSIDASIHIAQRRGDVVEYPDYVLSLGPRGGVKIESA